MQRFAYSVSMSLTMRLREAVSKVYVTRWPPQVKATLAEWLVFHKFS